MISPKTSNAAQELRQPAILLDVNHLTTPKVNILTISKSERSADVLYLQRSKHKKSFSFSDQITISKDFGLARRCPLRGDKLKKGNKHFHIDLSELFGKKVKMSYNSR